MQINFEDLIKDQILFLLLPIILVVVLLGGSIYTGINAANSFSLNNQKNEILAQENQRNEEFKEKLRLQEIEENSPDIKKIFNVQSVQFGMDASFAPLFDHLLSVAKESGIRIRAVDYNYKPEGDPVFDAKIPNHNVCELTTTIVGKYSEIQTFLKTLLAEKYLVNFAQIEVVSWKRDKSILIANLKIRFYTKSN